MKRMNYSGPVLSALMLTGATPALSENLFDDLASQQGKTISLSGGQLEGRAADGVASFLGIPYAAPPVGPLRWMPPQPPEAWDGVLDASAFGESCLQTQTYGVFAEPSSSEDCLYLNVFAPTTTSDDPRPVMVWIHGGSLINGRADDYDGRKLAKDGDVIVVTLNYRLNVMGYFSQVQIDAEGHPFGNYGTLDQQAALQWVQDNIADFGGDPDNVTLFGKSAGGLAVLFNMVSPGAEGLFHKAILQSGVSASPQQPLDAAQEKGQAFAEAMNCADADDVPSCLRDKSVDEIVAAGAFTEGSTRVVDGEILPGQMQDLMAAGEFHQVPILMGNNQDEWTWFISLAEQASGETMTTEGYIPAYEKAYGPERAALIAEGYPLGEYASPSEAAAAAGTARNFICPSQRVMDAVNQRVPLFVYEFADRDAPHYFEDASFPYGAAHTLDLQYIFPRYHGATGTIHPLSDSQTELSDTMIAYWTNFARTGDPNAEGLPEWQQWSQAEPAIQILDDDAIETAATSRIDHRCGFWNNL